MHVFHILLFVPTVTLRSRNGMPFKGYLMKVMSSNGVTEGRWGEMKSIQHIVGDCGVTHNNNTETNETTIAWRAPLKPLMDTIQFK